MNPIDTDSRRVTLAEMVDAMNHVDDEAPFRWFQDSYVASDGSIHAGETLLVTMGQARKELGVAWRPKR